MWLVAINPTSGRGKGAQIGAQVIEFLHQKNLPYLTISGNSAADLRKQLDLHIHMNPRNEISGILCVGGDGLAHLVLQIAVPQHIPFAVIPAGTGNDIVRSLGWSLDHIDNYLERIISDPPQSIDLGNVDSEWFAAILSTGFDSVVNERANKLAWPTGPQRYNVAIALELPRFQPIQYTLELDTATITTEAMLIAIANGRCYGGGMLVCPSANVHDGLFDIMILKPVSKIEFLKVFPKVYSGAHVNHPQVEIIRSSKVRLTAQAVAYADGERIGPAPISAECVRAAGLTWIL